MLLDLLSLILTNLAADYQARLMFIVGCRYIQFSAILIHSLNELKILELHRRDSYITAKVIHFGSIKLTFFSFFKKGNSIRKSFLQLIIDCNV